jgi:hypothetical protein
MDRASVQKALAPRSGFGLALSLPCRWETFQRFSRREGLEIACDASENTSRARDDFRATYAAE